jgi:hypothetical protein
MFSNSIQFFLVVGNISIGNDSPNHTSALVYFTSFRKPQGCCSFLEKKNILQAFDRCMVHIFSISRTEDKNLFDDMSCFSVRKVSDVQLTFRLP